MGIDLSIVDVTKTGEAEWLRALIWPEQQERRILLEQALAIRQSQPLDLRTGDGFAMAPGIAAAVSDDELPCLYHMHVANQAPAAAIAAFQRELASLGRERDLSHVSNNIHPDLHLTAYRHGSEIDLPLARTAEHGQWIAWLATGGG